jgi:hypothetical protein
MKEQKSMGKQVDERHIKKHKFDVFRLALLLAPTNTYVIPEGMIKDMLQFVDSIKDELPDKNMFKAMGASGAKADDLLEVIKTNFKLK